jgi:flagellar biosynthesis protein FlhB
MSDQGQKTEQATPRKLHKAREQGQFLSARECVGAIQFLAVTAIVTSFGPDWVVDSKAIFRGSIRQAFSSDLTASDVVALVKAMLTQTFVPLGVLGGILATIALAAQLAVSGMGFSLKKIAPTFGRINPLSRLKEMAGQAAGLAIHAAVLFVVIAGVVYSMIGETLPLLLDLPLATLASGMTRVGGLIESLLWKCAAILVVFGAIDFFRQKRRMDKQLKMTKQEVRDEMKETEGNVHVKGRIRRLRGELLRRRMMSQVPTATAVIVNPTHYAVAIRYDAETMASPVVVAKGKNYLALRIREKATKHQVPIVENPPLARALYGSAEVGQQIPVEFYRAVAEILAYLYGMMNRRHR